MKRLIYFITFIFILSIIFYFSKDRTKVYILNTQIKKSNTKYEFTKNNNIQTIKILNKNISYKYDKYGRKIEKLLNQKVISKYLWLEKDKPLALLDKNEKILQTYNYKSKNNQLPFSMKQNGKKYFFIYNKMKSLRVVIDENKKIVKVLDYNLNGEIIKDTNPTFQVMFGYAGGIYEKEENLIYFKEGVYNPSVAKWVTKVEDFDIIENLKELNSLNPKEVYECSDTLDTYYHSFLCTNNQCGGLYASNYLNYLNGSGEIIDNSNYFNKNICKKINPIYKNSNQQIFSQCVSKMIKPITGKKFDLFTNNCHQETKKIIETCSKVAKIKKGTL